MNDPQERCETPGPAPPGPCGTGEVRWDGSCVSDELAVAETNGLRRE